MWLDAALAIAHHLAVFGLAAILAAEIVLLSADLSRDRLQTLGRVDGAYGLLAVIVLTAGLLRAVYGIKGWGFYAGNPVFWAKLSLFIVIGLVSVVPTVGFIRWRKRGGQISAAERGTMRKLATLQLALLFALPVLAALMARGIGLKA
jgi:putative membrane protein